MWPKKHFFVIGILDLPNGLRELKDNSGLGPEETQRIRRAFDKKIRDLRVVPPLPVGPTIAMGDAIDRISRIADADHLTVANPVFSAVGIAYSHATDTADRAERAGWQAEMDFLLGDAAHRQIVARPRRLGPIFHRQLKSRLEGQPLERELRVGLPVPTLRPAECAASRGCFGRCKTSPWHREDG